MNKFKQIILLTYLSLISVSVSSEDVLLETYMTEEEFVQFKERVGRAVAEHPEFKSSQANLKATYAQLKGSKAALRPQIKVLLDSNNAIARKYKNEATNLVERSQADHKTNVRFSINQLLYDFGASQYEVSMNESLTKASRADLSNKVLEDFFLMSQCKHFAVAPTSFHWWAAWLNNGADKICLRPSNEFLNPSNNSDFWPKNWISI